MGTEACHPNCDRCAGKSPPYENLGPVCREEWGRALSLRDGQPRFVSRVDVPSRHGEPPSGIRTLTLPEPSRSYHE